MKFLFFPTAIILYAFLLSSCGSTPSKKGVAMITIPAASPEIVTMGRTHIKDDKSIVSGFPGVSIKTEVMGKALSAELHSSTGNSWIDVIVDGGTPTVMKITDQPSSVALFTFAEAARHTVEIIHRTENWQGQVTLTRFSLDGEKFLTPPSLPKRKMLILGDSVTCGEAIDRVAGEEKNSRWWNARESYGMLAAKSLNAQVQLVCWGGRGLIRSWNGKTDDGNLGEFYEYAVGDSDLGMRWNHAQYQPDLIVSAIGTNDFSIGIPEREIYVTAYVKLINKLLANHPRAHIALMEGAILSGDKKAALIDYIREAISRVNDSRVHQVTSTHHAGDSQDAHPTKEQHAAMADELAPQLKSLMHW